MAADAEDGEEGREPVDEGEGDLDDNHSVYEAGEEFLGEDGVLFDELGEVVKSGS